MLPTKQTTGAWTSRLSSLLRWQLCKAWWTPLRAFCLSQILVFFWSVYFHVHNLGEPTQFRLVSSVATFYVLSLGVYFYYLLHGIVAEIRTSRIALRYGLAVGSPEWRDLRHMIYARQLCYFDGPLVVLGFYLMSGLLVATLCPGALLNPHAVIPWVLGCVWHVSFSFNPGTLQMSPSDARLVSRSHPTVISSVLLGWNIFNLLCTLYPITLAPYLIIGPNIVIGCALLAVLKASAPTRGH